MSQTAQAPPPPLPVPTPPVPAAAPTGSPGGAVGRFEAAARDRSVPGKLTVLRLGVTVLLIVWAAVTAGQLFLSWQSTNAAAGDVEQLIRVQNVKVDLLRADALATNAFLVGGLESSQQRAAYDEAVQAASSDITRAARAQPADEAVLTELGNRVVGYAGTMELARANNRQGFPVGAAYLADASSQLRSRGLALVDAVVTSNTSRSHTSLADQHPWWILLPGLVAIGALVWVNQWVARRFKRRINVGVGLAAAVVALLSVAAFAASRAQLQENDSLRQGAFATVVAGADARGSANLAKSAESLRLIARGSGAAQEKSWVENAATVTASLTEAAAPSGIVDQWKAYADAHAALIAKDDNGDWDGAVADATGTGPASVSAKFTAFDTSLGELVTNAGDRTSETLGSGNWLFLLWSGASVLGGLVAAALAWRGLAQRLKEFE